ncbi:MAG: hypothetical protein PHX13_00945 [Thiovulaceae bacterium]|nr:hypothetical protein [Sulfurimonadaceae bacterium]
MPTNKPFQAYQNESDALTIGADLTVENRLDRISIYGSIDLTKDKEGLQYAYELKRIIDSAIDELKGSNLPEHVEVKKVDIVENPFV